MEVLFRAEVIGIGSMAESRIKKLTQIGNRFYCIGFESLLDGQYVIIDKDGNDCFECKYDTRAIHFEDMIDLDKNKIFASLQENKKHGDIIHNIIAPNNFGKMIVYWNSHRNAVCYEEEKYCTPLQFLLKDELKDYKIIGIQQ